MLRKEKTEPDADGAIVQIHANVEKITTRKRAKLFIPCSTDSEATWFINQVTA